MSGTFSFSHPLKSINEYDAIGFDMDHTVARYKLRPFMKCIADAFCIHLITTYNYPKEIFIDENDFEFAMNNAIIDIIRGNILKLGADKQILRAYHGFTELTKLEIESIYGKPAKFLFSEDFRSKENSHVAFAVSYYDTHMMMILMKVISIQDKHKMLQEKSYQQIYFDIDKVWDIFDVDDPIFKQYLQDNPSKFLHKLRPDFLKALERLRENGKTVFLITNASYPWANIVMTYIIGNDWLAKFSFYIVNAKKPDIWNKNNEGIIVDPKTGQLLNKVDKITEGMIMKGGNEGLILEFVKAHSKKEEIHLLFYGDHLLSDFVYTVKPGSNWDKIIIMEELQEIENGINYEVDYFYYQSKWGSALLDRDLEGNLVETFWLSFVRKHFNGIMSLFMGEQNQEFYNECVSIKNKDNEQKKINNCRCVLNKNSKFQNRKQLLQIIKSFQT